MVLSQKDDSIQHRIFHDLPEYLEPGDLLVVNNSKVLPARIVGIKQPTGAVCELLLLRQVKSALQSPASGCSPVPRSALATAA